MKQIQIPRFGSPEVLQCVDVPLPPATPHQCRVQVAYAGINPIDYKTRAGLGWAAEQNRDRLPWIPGYDIAGQVLTEGVFPAGTQVCGMVGFPLEGGGYAEQLDTSPESLCVVPPGMSLAQAAALPLAGLTAWQGLFQHGQLQAGEQVLILGANGGVGHLAVQLAVAQGAVVIAVARERHKDWLTRMGAAQVLAPDELDASAAQADLLLDLVGGELAEQALHLVRSGGRMVTVPTVTADRVMAAAEAAGLHGARMLVSAEPAQLNGLLQLCAAGKLKVQVERIFALEQAGAAHHWLEQGGHRGKALLQMNE